MLGGGERSSLAFGTAGSACADIDEPGKVAPVAGQVIQLQRFVLGHVGA